MCVGSIAIQMYQFEETLHVDPGFGLPPGSAFVPIWPVRGTDVVWPPATSLDDGAIREVIERTTLSAPAAFWSVRRAAW
jgi:hypothetical protein